MGSRGVTQSTWGFSVCVSSEATCSSLFSLLPSLRPSRLRPIPSTATMVLSHTPMVTPLLAFLSDPPRDWTLSPRELFLLLTTTARGPLMLRPIPTTLEDTLLPISLLDTHLARTPSPRASMPPPRDTLPTPTATSATTTVKFRELTRHVC